MTEQDKAVYEIVKACLDTATKANIQEAQLTLLNALVILQTETYSTLRRIEDRLIQGEADV